jgi:hypothetical protein
LKNAGFNCVLQIMNKKIFGLVILMLLTACSEKKTEPRPAVFDLQQIGKLATAEYWITRVVKADDNQTWYKMGNRKILITCSASVKAGIDFSRLQPQHVDQQQHKIYVKLPPPQLISLNIPPEGIKVVYSDVGVFRDPFTTGEINAIMRTAESQIRKQVESLDINTTARTNATAFLTRFLRNAGFTEIYVSF